jgi:hypothetical protein
MAIADPRFGWCHRRVNYRGLGLLTDLNQRCGGVGTMPPSDSASPAQKIAVRDKKPPTRRPAARVASSDNVAAGPGFVGVEVQVALDGQAEFA